MDDHVAASDIRDIDTLKRMSLRICAGDPPSRLEIERALEVGFARLIGLEAELARVRKAPADVHGQVEQLVHHCELLRDTLTELRTLSAPADPPRIGYGFVLPGHCAARRLRNG